ncbi:hypothetical protein Leryth_017691 [Lithospermum erythrorhizon]|nr:hypothetical protein Leryth_017691 [Lithospermum erythrorhizon]
MQSRNGGVWWVVTVFLMVVGGSSKSTIEPCSNSERCSSLVAYKLYTELKVSEVASLFNVDPIALLTANSIDISYPDVENHILPSRYSLRVPLSCSCQDGIFKSTSTLYKTRPGDTLSFISDTLYSRLVSSDQINDANHDIIHDVLPVATTLSIPLPCTCFNGTDNNLPAIYMAYVVTPLDTLPLIASSHSTTITDLMNVNALATPAISDGDILAIPLSACASDFPTYASDFALSIPNGSYAITASHCVQCSCGPGSRNLYCIPASLAVSCSSMQCRGSNLMLGNSTMQQTSAGCNVTSCSYGGFVNGSIVTTLSTSLQPRCPGPQQFPPLVEPPTKLAPESIFAPAPAPMEGGGARIPGTSVVPSSGMGIAFPPANAPSGFGLATGASDASSLVNPVTKYPFLFVLGFSFTFVSLHFLF